MGKMGDGDGDGAGAGINTSSTVDNTVNTTPAYAVTRADSYAAGAPFLRLPQGSRLAGAPPFV